MKDDILLEVKNLRTHFFLEEGVVRAVDGADLGIRRGATLGLVGESGCGKSVTGLSILQLVQKPGRIVGGEVIWHRHGDNGGNACVVVDQVDLAALDARSREMRAVRGGEIAMIFQEPMSALSMMHTVGCQITEAIRLHCHVGNREARERAISLLDRVGIPKASERVDSYPFEFSGGMRQRAMIAMALSCNPSLVIADEPTTSLDVTTQAQIMELMLELQSDLDMSIFIITHDLGIIAETCDEVAVMYLGEVVEQADVDSLFHDPKHPYTQALLRSIPRLGYSRLGRLDPIKGSVPHPYDRPTGCFFHPRCSQMIPGRCQSEHPVRVDLPGGRSVKCLLYEGVA